MDLHTFSWTLPDPRSLGERATSDEGGGTAYQERGAKARA